MRLWRNAVRLVDASLPSPQRIVERDVVNEGVPLLQRETEAREDAQMATPPQERIPSLQHHSQPESAILG